MNSRDNNGNLFVYATVYLYQDGNILGYEKGYEIIFEVGFRKQLTYAGRWPNIENVEFFKAFPPEVVIGFFADKVKSYLEKGIEDGWITVR